MSSTVTLPQRRSGLRSSPTACATTLAFVFLLGAGTGAIAMRYRMQYSRQAPFYTEAGKAQVLKRWTKELNLSPDQAAAADQVLSDFAIYYRNVLNDGKTRLNQILNAEQREKLNRLMQQSGASAGH